jgi:hypothetical protein
MNSFKNSEWNNIKVSNIHIKEIKKYIDDLLKCDFVLNVFVFTKKNGKYDKCCIECISRNIDNIFPIVRIYPEVYLYKYDPDALKGNTNIIDVNKKEKYIQDQRINKILDKIVDEIREKFVKKIISL